MEFPSSRLMMGLPTPCLILIESGRASWGQLISESTCDLTDTNQPLPVTFLSTTLELSVNRPAAKQKVWGEGVSSQQLAVSLAGGFSLSCYGVLPVCRRDEETNRPSHALVTNGHFLQILDSRYQCLSRQFTTCIHCNVCICSMYVSRILLMLQYELLAVTH